MELVFHRSAYPHPRGHHSPRSKRPLYCAVMAQWPSHPTRVPNSAHHQFHFSLRQLRRTVLGYSAIAAGRYQNKIRDVTRRAIAYDTRWTVDVEPTAAVIGCDIGPEYAVCTNCYPVIATAFRDVVNRNAREVNFNAVTVRRSVHIFNSRELRQANACEHATYRTVTDRCALFQHFPFQYGGRTVAPLGLVEPP